MNVPTRLFAFGLMAVLPCLAWAEAPIEVGQPTSIVLEPVKFDLIGKRARQQLLITGKYAGEEVRDLTPVATLVTSNPDVVKIDGTVALPVGNGEATLTATISGQSVSVPVVVKNIEAPALHIRN